MARQKVDRATHGLRGPCATDYGGTRVDRKAWDRLAPTFESSVYDIAAIDSNGVLTELVGLTRPRPTRDTLVDLGCGIGTFVGAFGDRFAAIVAVDFSPVMIERARARLGDDPRIEWVVGDIPRAARVLSKRADLAVCLNVITSTSSAKRAAIWDALRVVTRRGAHVLVVVPAFESAEVVAAIDRRVRIGDGRSARNVETDGTAQKYFTHDELVSTVPRHGLEIVRLEPVPYPWSEELSDGRRSGRRRPFDWAILARHTAPN